MNFPPYAVPLILIVATLSFAIWQRTRRKAAMANSVQHTLGSIAQRLGLALVEGDPNLNFMYFERPNFAYKRRLKLQGTPGGRRVEFLLVDSVENTLNAVVYRETTYSWACHLVLTTNVPLPDFEVVRRNPNQYLRPDRALDPSRVPAIPTGNASLDQIFEVLCPDPRVGPAVANALGVIASLEYVHFFGRGNCIIGRFTRFGLPYFAHSAETYLLALQTMASCFDGQPATAQVLPLAAPVLTR
jgi:hypothetical protein